MASITISLGDAFLIDTPPDKHLYIAIAQTTENKYLFVNVTSRRPNSESACVLLPGSGVPSFVVHESVVTYKYAREIDATGLAQLSAIRKGSCSITVLTQIQKGGIASKKLTNKYKNALKTLLGIPP